MTQKIRCADCAIFRNASPDPMYYRTDPHAPRYCEKVGVWVQSMCFCAAPVTACQPWIPIRYIGDLAAIRRKMRRDPIMIRMNPYGDVPADVFAIDPYDGHHDGPTIQYTSSHGTISTIRMCTMWDMLISNWGRSEIEWRPQQHPHGAGE